MIEGQALPPHQVWGKKFVIYAALGIPRVDAGKWSLKVDGLVSTPLQYTYSQLTTLRQTSLVRSFHCLLPGSMVFTDSRPMPIEHISEGTRIIGGDGLPHPVSRTVSKRVVGTIIGIKATYLPPARMTRDHPVWAVTGNRGHGKTKSRRRMLTFRGEWKANWTNAEELRLGDYVFFPKYRYVSPRTEVVWGEHVFPIDEKLAQLTGWYVAEGSGAGSDGRTVAFSLNSKETDYGYQVKNLLEELFRARVGEYTNSRGTLLKLVASRSTVGALHHMMRDWCGEDALSKRIPGFILNSNRTILRHFLVSCFHGDGYSKEATERNHRDVIDFTTSSRALSYQLLLALSKLEIPGELVNHPGSVRTGFSVRVAGEKIKNLLPDFKTWGRVNRFRYEEVKNGFYFPIRETWTEPYNGIVYDFQAPPLYTMLSPFVTQDCVTRWSIRDAQWEGLPIRSLVEPAGVSPEASWVMFHCADGYSAPVPLEDAMKEDSILAFRLNGKPLSAEQGFPARPFIPGLYAWKSAKWVNRMELLPGYRDGYWESYGYHERADVWEEERFKGHSGTPVRRRAFGTA